MFGCSAPVGPAGSFSTIGFWEMLRIGGDEVEYYPTLEDMANGADAVVLGRFGGSLPGRTVHGDASEDVVAYLVTRLDVSRMLAGHLDTDIVTVEFLVNGGPTPEGLAWLQENLPDGDIVLFLRGKRGKGEEGLYRPVSSVGLWASSQRAVLDTPLAESAPTDSVFRPEIANLSSVLDLADYISSTQSD